MRPLTLSPTDSGSWQMASRRKSLSVSTLLAEAADRVPDRVLTVDGLELSCEDAWMRVLRIATWMKQNGVGRGDKVVTVLRHSPELHLISLAVAHVGAVLSVLSCQTRAEEFESVLAEAEPVCLFLERSSRHLKANAPDMLTVWMDEGLNEGGWDEADFSEVMATTPDWGMPCAGRAEDPALLVFPRGSTSGLLLSHDKVNHLMSDRSGGATSLLALFDEPAAMLA